MSCYIVCYVELYVNFVSCQLSFSETLCCFTFPIWRHPKTRSRSFSPLVVADHLWSSFTFVHSSVFRHVNTRHWLLLCTNAGPGFVLPAGWGWLWGVRSFCRVPPAERALGSTARPQMHQDGEPRRRQQPQENLVLTIRSLTLSLQLWKEDKNNQNMMFLWLHCWIIVLPFRFCRGRPLPSWLPLAGQVRPGIVTLYQQHQHLQQLRHGGQMECSFPVLLFYISFPPNFFLLIFINKPKLFFNLLFLFYFYFSHPLKHIPSFFVFLVSLFSFFYYFESYLQAKTRRSCRWYATALLLSDLCVAAADLQLLPLQDLRLPGVRRGDHGRLDGGRLQPQHHLPFLWKPLPALPERGVTRHAQTRQVCTPRLTA